MSDDTSARTQQGEQLMIDISKNYELRYWSANIGVSQGRLKDAVQKVGPIVKDVRAELRK